MARNVAIGIQQFDRIRENDYFYVDKTDFIREWWESGDSVTLVTRPRRFGKTLNMSMVEQFFSVDYRDRGDLFEGLAIWEEEKYRALQGTYPVIGLSFANVKELDYGTTNYRIRQLLTKQFEKFSFLLGSDVLSDTEKAYYEGMCADMGTEDAPMALYQLSDYLSRYYGKRVLILLDEYDTPMQEAYVRGFWDELVAFTRSLFNSTFKTNPYLERGLMTGITRVSKESIFSDLNNLKVITTTSDEYATSFGFTEEEVFASLEECGLSDKKEKVKTWYDGFTFGKHTDIYNPWSVINFLDTGKYGTYWANTSSNSLAGILIRKGSSEVKGDFESLLRGETIQCALDEQIVYNQLDHSESAIWSLLLASGYLRCVDREELKEDGKSPRYELCLTNYEVKCMFFHMVEEWFAETQGDYNDFVKALLLGDLKAMNAYMKRVVLAMFSSFDSGTRPSGATTPERFYHGFVLGLLVELQGRYVVTSNRESGFGRYDVMLEPLKKEDHGIILEFKVHDPEDEADLAETARAALAQIEEKQYRQILLDHGVEADRIRSYGFAFEGKAVLIAGA